MTVFKSKAINPKIDKEHLSRNINASITFHLLSNNLDILGELLMDVLMLQTTGSSAVQSGWKLLGNIWDTWFYILSNFESSIFKTLLGTEDGLYASKHLYHKSYLGGILSNILLNNKNNVKAEYPNIFPSIEMLFEGPF
ncbi:MAG: hypothetical protein KKA81_01220 [Bacteroidetes bacterium]|nr:hypothetical protein [Bacteroidota bacterium]